MMKTKVMYSLDEDAAAFYLEETGTAFGPLIRGNRLDHPAKQIANNFLSWLGKSDPTTIMSDRLIVLYVTFLKDRYPTLTDEIARFPRA